MNLGSKEPKKDDYAPTPNRSNFQSDKCASFQLRTHLTEVGFRKCWMIMATLGWKYDIKQGLYYTPFGLNMGKSTECMRRLDYYALGGVTFRFDMVHECVANETNTDMDRKYEENQEKKLKQTRHELLAAIFTRFYAGARCSDSHSDGIKVNVGKIKAIKGKNHTSEKKLDCGEKSSTNNVGEMQYSLPLPSATANEKGAEQFFDNKKLQKPKSKIKLYINPVKKGTTKTVNDKPQPITSLGKRKADKDSFQPSETSVKKKMIRQMEQWPSPKTCVKSLQDNMHGHNKSIESKPSLVVLEESLSKQFTEWKFLQSTQHSFLLYGFGSKKSLLDKFTEEELSTAGDVLTFNGYDCDINIHTILDFMVQIFLNGVEPPPSIGTELSNVRERILFEVQGNSSFHQESNSSSSKVLGRAVAISKQLAKQHPRPIYLVVHSIDGINLQNQVAQEALANLVWNSQTLVDEEQSDLMEKHSLSSVGNNDNQKHVTRAIPSRVIRLIASVDHVDASSSLWDSSTLNKFSWIWKSVNTHRPYYDEVQHGMITTTNKINKSRLNVSNTKFMERVLKSLAPRHAEIIKELAKLQLAIAKKSISSSISFVKYRSWKHQCMIKMIISNETEFQNMISELLDHGMLKCSKNENTGEKIFCVPTSDTKLREILHI